MARRKNMEALLERWLSAHRIRHLPEEPHRGYVKPVPIDEEQVRRQAVEARAWIKEQQQ